MIKTTITIQNKLGLHARASAKLVKEASRYASQIHLTNDKNQEVNAKSIMGVIMLGARIGTMLTLTIDGEDEAAAEQAITTLINNKFGEHDED